MRAVRADAEHRRDEARQRAAEYRETGGPYPERLPVIALSGKLLLEHAELLARWAAWAEQEVQAWGGVTPADGAVVPDGALAPGWSSAPAGTAEYGGG